MTRVVLLAFALLLLLLFLLLGWLLPRRVGPSTDLRRLTQIHDWKVSKTGAFTDMKPDRIEAPHHPRTDLRRSA